VKMKKKQRTESILELLEGLSAAEAQRILVDVSKVIQRKSFYRPMRNVIDFIQNLFQ